MKIRHVIVYFILFKIINVYGQDTLLIKASNTKKSFYLSLQYVGLTFHPNGGNTPEIYPLKFDKKAYFVLEVGASLNLDYYLNDKLFIRASIAHYRDCAFVPAGYFHLGIRGLIFKKGKHRINGGIGPTLMYREDWHQFPEYKGDEFYGESIHGKWQYRFIIYGGEFEYLYQINDKVEFQYSLIPGIPIIITSKFGIRIKI